MKIPSAMVPAAWRVGVTLALLGGGQLSAQETAEEFSAARQKIVQKYDDEVKSAQERLLAEFAQEVTQQEKRAVKDLKEREKLKKLEAYRDRFRDRRKLPPQNVLVNEVKQYEAKSRKANDRALDDLDKLLKKANAKSLNAFVEETKQQRAKLQADLAALFPARLLFTAEHVVNGANRYRKEFYSDGTIDKNPNATWSLNGRVLILRFKDAAAPGGAWVDQCKVAENFATYDGKNQQGARISGTITVVED